MKIRGEGGPSEHFLSELKNVTQKLKGGHTSKNASMRTRQAIRRRRRTTCTLSRTCLQSAGCNRVFAMGTQF